MLRPLSSFTGTQALTFKGKTAYRWQISGGVQRGVSENLSRRQGFKDFIINQGCDILHPDLRNTGGFLETKRIADLAEVFALPMATHNTGSLVHTIATAHWASTVRDFLASETVLGHGDWMDDVVIHEDRVIKDGHIQPADRPGLGLELNPDVVKAHLAQGESYWDQDRRG